MTNSVPRDVLLKVRKLAEIAADLRRGENFEITRLTSLKSLCRDPSVANRFVVYLARETLHRPKKAQNRSARSKTRANSAHRKLMADALVEMEAFAQHQTEARRRDLRDLLEQMRAEQNEYKRIKWGSVRIIHDWDLLLFEDALSCMLYPADQAGYWAYQIARHYAERYDSHYGTGLIPTSAPLVQDIVDFLREELGLDRKSLTAPTRTKKMKDKKRSSTRSGEDASAKDEKVRFTHRQGQFLAFIHLFHKVHRQGPAETDMVKFFRVTPPSVHDMIVRLEELGLVTRQPGVARSVRVAIPEDEIPTLEENSGPPW